ncbi:MAG: hypothetical protein KKH08_04050 [Candidatus Omnitrophica bacterium]|nr:hypothetical protein [Candidatus Omnitrophota bacterium]
MKLFVNNRVMRVFLAALLLYFSGIEILFAKDSVIMVYCDKKIGEVNNRVFGNNQLAYDPATYENFNGEYYGYSDYGAGIWDPKRKRSVKEVVNLAKEAGMSVMRFPGGCGAHHYDWRSAIGKDRAHFLYGIDEFLRTCEEINAEAIITVSYFTGNEQDAADLTEYLLSPCDGANPNGGIDWAKKRAENGHPLPYSNVKYFEIGNEVYHGDHRKIKEVSPDEYGNRYLKYYESMKTVEPGIEIGVVLCPIYWKNWNKRVLNIIKDKVDFGIIHTYPSPEEGDLESMKPKQIFEISLGVPIFKDEAEFQNILKLLKERSGKDVSLVVTEYNGGFTQEKPVPYRHCLGTALINAELLRIFMKPEHKILLATYWQFCNSYWGMVKSKEDYVTHDYRYPVHYIKRPNYYAFELYNKHFGSELIGADVECDSYRVKGYAIPYLSVNASTNADKNKVYLIVINKNLGNSVTATIDLKDFYPSAKGSAFVLNGPDIDSTNETNADNVTLRSKEFKIKDNPFEFTFEPHSLTAIEITRYRDE